jgi:hypothetical protein
MTHDLARIEQFEAAGVHRGVYWLPAAGRDEVEAAFDRVAATMSAYRRAGG